MGLSERELALLQVVLDFYDGFAERNETNSQLQGEAARAYRKVAALYRVLGREPEAEQAQARALERFESLVRRHGEASEYRYDLARTLALDGPGAHTVPVERAEPELRRAIAIVEQLFQGAPDDKRSRYAAALARWYFRLAEFMESLGRADEAVADYRASIAHDEWLAGQFSEPGIVSGMLAIRRATLAELLVRLGRKDEARTVVDRAAAEARRAISEEGRPFRGGAEVVAGSLQSLASSYRSLGEDRGAVELEDLSSLIRERSREGRPGRRGGGSAPSKGDPRGNGRGRPSGPPVARPGH